MGEHVPELWSFLKERKKFWLLPIIVVLGLLVVLIVFSQIAMSPRNISLN
jgi:hypothetical protein